MPFPSGLAAAPTASPSREAPQDDSASLNVPATTLVAVPADGRLTRILHEVESGPSSGKILREVRARLQSDPDYLGLQSEIVEAARKATREERTALIRLHHPAAMGRIIADAVEAGDGRTVEEVLAEASAVADVNIVRELAALCHKGLLTEQAAWQACARWAEQNWSDQASQQLSAWATGPDYPTTVAAIAEMLLQQRGLEPKAKVRSEKPPRRL